MKTAIRYFSRGGNTEKLARAAAQASGSPAISVKEALHEDVDVLFLGASLYKGTVDEEVKRFIREIHVNVGRVVLFSTSASKRSPYKKIEALLREKGIKLAREEYYCPGSFLFFNRGRPDEKDLDAMKKFVSDIVG